MARAATPGRSGRQTRRAPVSPRVRRRGDLGLGALIVSPEPMPALAIDASWAWSLRRFARHLLWAVPVYAVVYGLVTLDSYDGGGVASYLAGGRPRHLLGWLAAVWLGLLALLALTALLAATRSRRFAGLGLVLGLSAAVLTLPFAVLPERQPVGVMDAETLVLAGATVHSLAWVSTGWAVLRSRLLAVGDGVVLLLAAPMLGVAGLLVGPLQTVGALLALAAGIGIAWRGDRLMPAPEREFAAAAGADAVANQAAAEGGLATP